MRLEDIRTPPDPEIDTSTVWRHRHSIVTIYGVLRMCQDTLGPRFSRTAYSRRKLATMESASS